MKKKAFAALLSLCVCVLFTGCSRVYNASEYVFDSEIKFEARLYGKRTEAAAREMTELFAALAQAADTTDPNSVLSRVNAASVGDRVEIDAICYQLIAAAETLYEETDGAFNIALEPLSRLWNVDAEAIHRYKPSIGETPYPSPDSLPDLAAVNERMAYAHPGSWNLTEADGKYYITKSAPVELDLGGLAKGWAADRCAEIAAEYKLSARLDVGGNLYLVGKYYNDKTGRDDDWMIGVNAPRPRPALFRDYVAVLKHGGDVSIVTSGDYERFYFYKETLAVPHIIGRNGIPIGVVPTADGYVNSGDNVISATVIGKSSMLCDAYATAVSVMGLEEGMRFLNDTDYGALLFTADGKMARKDAELAMTDVYSGFASYEEVRWTR